MKDLDLRYLYPENPKRIKYPIYPLAYQIFDYILLSNPFSLKMNTKGLISELKKLYYDSEIILTNSGSSALKLSFICLDIKKNDEVMLTNFTCPNVIDAVIACGGTPVFIDIENDFSLSISDIKKKMTDKTKVIILTHIYGFKENHKIIEWAHENNVFIIDDGAQSMFTLQENKHSGGHGDIGILSFGLTKPLSSIGGGAMIINNEILPKKPPELTVESKDQVYKDYKSYFNSLLLSKVNQYYIFSKIYSWKNKKTNNFTSKIEAFPKNIDSIKIRKMSLLRERIIIKQFKKMGIIRSRNNSNYEEMFKNLSFLEDYNIRLLIKRPEESPNYFTLIFPKENVRYECSKYLAKKGIQTSWNYVPLDNIPLYSKYRSNNKNVNLLWSKVLSIPFKYPLVRKDIRYISTCLREYVENNLSRKVGDSNE